MVRQHPEVAGPDHRIAGHGVQGFSKLDGLFMAPMIRRETRKDLLKLKTILEP
ncbi:hypothetical protein [Pseudarthrobacter oxydans]|uniref:hypothetical protein n=1 Tax=Pseudarthrobacter oxydans TaxID=1671 RepID=UPI00344B24B0